MDKKKNMSQQWTRRKPELLAKFRQWDEFVTAMEKQSKPVVVVSGQQNCGKSSLLQCLFEDWHGEIFLSGDKRITTDLLEKEQAGVVYIDTPGYGTGYERDTTLTRSAWNRADFVIFLHSMHLGELSGEEVNMLEELKGILPDAAERILFLCSKTGGRPNEKVFSKVDQQVRKILGEKAHTHSIDNRHYIDGSLKNEPRLQKSSGIADVKQWLEQVRNAPSLHRQRIEAFKDELLHDLYQVSAELSEEHTKLQKKSNALSESMFKYLKDFLEDTFRELWDDCKNCAQRVADIRKRIRVL